MTLEEAISTAVKYETKIRDVYLAAARKILGPAGKSFFEIMAGEEQHHVDYLLDRLARWKKTGELTLPKLETVVPAAESIARQMTRFRSVLSRNVLGDHKRSLSRALKVEIETSEFYEKMVSEMTGEGQDLFAQFLVIENRHIVAVQIQLDYATRTGYWFDMKEFDME